MSKTMSPERLADIRTRNERMNNAYPAISYGQSELEITRLLAELAVHRADLEVTKQIAAGN